MQRTSAELALTITELATLPIWPEVKEYGEVIILYGYTKYLVQIARCASPTGALRYFMCPVCQKHRCRSLFIDPAEGLAGPCCCHGVRRAPPGSKWGRSVVAPARQLQRLQERMDAGLDRNARRRAKRRQDRLLQGLHASLSDRYKNLRVEMMEALGI